MKNFFHTFKNLTLIIALLAIIPFSVYAAQKTDPIDTLTKITDKVLATLKANKRQIDKHPDRIYDIVNKVIVPHIDFEEISRWITGKKIWRTSTEIQRREFRKELKSVVVKTYAISLHNYSDEKIVFYPLKGRNKVLKKRMQISSKIVSEKNQDIHIDFRIISFKNTWRVYDLVVEGVSLIKGLQAQFTNLIKKEGITSVTNKMKNNSVKLENDAFGNKLKNISLNTDLILLKSNEGSRE